MQKEYKCDCGWCGPEPELSIRTSQFGSDYDICPNCGQEDSLEVVINPNYKMPEIEKGKEMIESLSGSRYNEGKVRWGLVDFKSLEPMVRVLEFGTQKYAVDDWKKGLDKKEILESMMRHLAALMDGETHDKESGLHHIGHIMANGLFYSYFNEEQ